MAQFQSWDMIAGRLCPELGGRPEYLDLLGVNYYSNNQWIHHCPSSLWGYAGDEGHREMYEPLAEELAHQQTLWDTRRRDHRAVEEAVNIDEIHEAARQVDVAAQKSRTRRRE